MLPQFCLYRRNYLTTEDRLCNPKAFRTLVPTKTGNCYSYREKGVVVVPDFVDADFRKLNLPDYPGKQKLIASGEKTFPVVRDLMRKLQDELLPVKVEGDVQWGVNFVEGQRSEVKGQTEEGKNHCLTSDLEPRTSRWLVWMMNNKGVTKYACEEEIVDHAFDAEVKVTDRATGRIYEKTIASGGCAWIEIK